ncbi:MAG: hypothetical protein EOO61_18565 [Hymenobacter sp.]|nr:MAG: hypothetical protein EOO61_18565 [Hymenobacter sp.]
MKLISDGSPGTTTQPYPAMRFSTAVAISLLAMLAFSACGQTSSSRSVLGQEYAKQQVEAAVKGTAKSLQPTVLLPTQTTAIAVVEPLLFNIYGARNIIKQRPYEVYLINGFWHIAGTLPKGYEGGTFEIIIAATDSKVIFLSHGK